MGTLVYWLAIFNTCSDTFYVCILYIWQLICDSITDPAPTESAPPSIAGIIGGVIGALLAVAIIIVIIVIVLYRVIGGRRKKGSLEM